MTRSDPQPDSGAPRRTGARPPLLLRLLLLPALLAPAAAAQEDPKPPTAPPAQPAPAATQQAKPPPATAPAVPPAVVPPAVPPVVPAAPLPGPKAVALAFAASLEKGDAATARALVPATDAHAKWVDAAAALAVALKKLDDASIARFGDPAGRAVSGNQLHLLDNLKALEQAQEKTDGDAATLTLPGQPTPLHLKRAEGRWLLQLPPDPAALPAQTRLFARLAQAADRTAREVVAGDHPTPAQAARTFAARTLEARLELE